MSASHPDIARPDLARPDLARPDLARPDLARPDLARPDLAGIVEDTKRQMAAITGLPADTVSEFDRAEGGWRLLIDMLEHRSIPRTHDLLASFEVTLDEAGQVLRWRRTGRFVRSQG